MTSKRLAQASFILSKRLTDFTVLLGFAQKCPRYRQLRGRPHHLLCKTVLFETFQVTPRSFFFRGFTRSHRVWRPNILRFRFDCLDELKGQKVRGINNRELDEEGEERAGKAHEIGKDRCRSLPTKGGKACHNVD